MNKIYLITISFGSWDSHHTKNIKCFYTLEKAEKYVEKAERVLTAFSYHINKVHRLEIERAESYIDMTDEEIDKAYGEIEDSLEYKKADTLYHSHWRLQEFNKCIIEELEIS